MGIDTSALQEDPVRGSTARVNPRCLAPSASHGDNMEKAQGLIFQAVPLAMNQRPGGLKREGKSQEAQNVCTCSGGGGRRTAHRDLDIPSNYCIHPSSTEKVLHRKQMWS